jgi:hypothetical protein
MILVELVKVGFLGFAVVVLLLSFRLLRGITDRSDLPDSAVSIRAREIRVYMGLSILVIALGLFWDQTHPQVTLLVDVRPDDMEGFAISVGAQPVDWKEGKRTVALGRYQEMTLDLVKIDRKLRGARDFNSQVKATQLKEAAKDFEGEEAGL